VNEAVCEQIGRGVNFSINHALEVELAEELVRTIPCAERVILATSHCHSVREAPVGLRFPT
jgi:glutamate-1-semialdehyde aminotransferase